MKSHVSGAEGSPQSYGLLFHNPRKFGYVGIVVGIGVALLWWYVRIFDPFHLPTWEQSPPNFRAPLLYWVINDCVFVLCPGTLLMFLTIGMRGWFSLFMWIFAVSLNGPIYFAIGLLVETLLKRRRIGASRAQGA